MHRRLLVVTLAVVLATVGCTMIASGDAWTAAAPTTPVESSMLNGKGQPSTQAEPLPQEAVVVTATPAVSTGADLSATVEISGTPAMTDTAAISSTEALTGTATVTSTTSISGTTQSAKKAGLLFFWAEWCGSCKKMRPMIEQLQEEYKDTIAFKLVNVDEPDAKEWARAYRVWAIPFFVLQTPSGEILGQWVGEQSESVFRTAFDEASQS